MATMYEQVTKSNEEITRQEVAVENQINLSNMDTAKFEQAKQADNKQQAAKKGWQTVTDDYGSQF